MRRFAEIAYGSLKTACFVAIGEGGGPRFLETITRVVSSQMSKYADTSKESEKKHMPIDVALDVDGLLVSLQKAPIITAMMAEILGFRLEPVSGGIPAGGPLTEADALRIMDESADFWRIARKAFEDGRIDALEHRQIREKLWQINAASQIALRKLNEMDFS